MKKSLIALAVLAAAGAASAQSSVTLFGIVDATLAYGKTDANNVTKLTNSGYNSSRIGFRGTEDLGGGMSASFWLEGTVGNDDGTTGQRIPTGNQTAVHAAADGAGLVFNRRSTVSLAGGWGEVRLGRDYVPSFWNLTVFDPFGTNGAGTTLTLLGAANAGMANVGTRGVLVRASNSIGYFLPGNLGGFYGQAMYYMGENLSNAGATSDDGQGLGARVGYANGPFNVALGFGRTKYATTATTGDFKTWNIGGQWDFGMAKLMGQYTRDNRDSTVELEGKGWLIGALVPVGAGEIRASYSTYEVDAGLTEPRAQQLALGYVHNLSKRTAVYATFARLKNKNGSAMSINGATGVVNGSATGYDFGVRHSF
ncbi:MAG: putative outer rane porin protein precursor [Ramlibacter sp.]|jgi:predicted porin|nr:putative outer rane porin protein precursor [Ramlibacter sp.]